MINTIINILLMQQASNNLSGQRMKSMTSNFSSIYSKEDKEEKKEKEDE